MPVKILKIYKCIFKNSGHKLEVSLKWIKQCMIEETDNFDLCNLHNLQNQYKYVYVCIQIYSYTHMCIYIERQIDRQIEDRQIDRSIERYGQTHSNDLWATC